MDHAGGYFGGKTPEIVGRSDDILHGVTQVVKIPVAADVCCFEIFEQALPVVPWHIVRQVHYIVAFECRQGEKTYIRYIELRSKSFIVGTYFIIHLLAVVHQIHFVHCQRDVFDTQQRYQVGMAAGLCDHTQLGIYKDHGQVGGRSSCNHIPRVLFVTGGVGNDEFPLAGRKIAVSNVNGDTLFPFSL